MSSPDTSPMSTASRPVASAMYPATVSVLQAPQRRELTEEERIYVQSGGADPRDAEEAAAA